MAKTTTKTARPKRRQEKIGVDWLTISYLYDKALFERIWNELDDMVWWGEEYQDNFYTYRIKDESSEDMLMVNIVLRLGVGDSNDRLLGTLTLHNTKKYEGRAFFAIENKALYTDMLCYVHYVEHVLGLVFNNITRLDIAMTSTYDYITAILKSVRNYDGLAMIYNRRKVVNPDETLKNFIEIFPQSRRKRLKPPTLVFGHKKKQGTQVRVYDKARELRENSPEKIGYFNEWLGFDYEKLYRVEITLTNVEVRDICAKSSELLAEWEHSGNIINLLMLPKFLTFAFCEGLSGVLHFKDKRTTIEVWDL